VILLLLIILIISFLWSLLSLPTRNTDGNGKSEEFNVSVISDTVRTGRFLQDTI
jgi:hypothetical protein